MQSRKKNDLFNETEAAAFLGISMERLHQLLDEHIFNDGNPRPAGLTFNHSELVLLGFWQGRPTPAKVVCMPSRS